MQQNATLLNRMAALEARFMDQETRALKAEETAAACASINEDFMIVKDGVDQLEKRQHEFMSAVHKRLVEMDKDIAEFRKTQERVNKLMASYRDLDDSVANMAVFQPRVEEFEREVQGLKNTISRKYVHEMESLDSRMGAVELERSRDHAKLRAVQDGFTQKWNAEFQALRTQVARLMATNKNTQIQHPYMQVPRSPEAVPRPAGLLENSVSITTAKPSDASNDVSHAGNYEQALRRVLDRPHKDDQVPQQDARTKAIRQASREAGIDERNSKSNTITNVSPRDFNDMGRNPRKRPKLVHPNIGLEPEQHAEPQAELIRRSVQKPRELDRINQVHMDASATHNSASNKKRRAPDPVSKKIPITSPIETLSKDQQKMATTSQRRTNAGRKAVPCLQTRQPPPSQHPTRRSRRRSAQATFYELGWDCTQQPQKTTGPVYDAPHKPLKTKPRRLPPVPDE